jgi:signal transduction histidine kinase
VLRRVNWFARAAGYIWVGVLAFALFRADGAYQVTALAISYGVLGLGLFAWAVLDVRPELGGRYGLTIVLAAMAVSAGFGSAVAGGSIGFAAFGFVAAMVAAGDLDLAPALAVTAAGVLSTEVSGLLVSASAGTLLGVPAIVLSGMVVGRNRGAYRVQAEQSAALLAQRERLQAEQRRADLLDERARIAREIHDVLAHSLGALGIQIQAARAVLTDHRDVEQAGELLAGAQQLAAEGLVETRRAVQALRTDPPPLAEELAQVSDTYAQRYRVGVDYDTSGSPVSLPPDASLALLRIAQEALVNAAKHAPRQGVTIRLDYRDHDVRLTVRNAVSPDAVAPELSTINGGYGLTGMRERLRLLNGTLDAGRRDTEWVVTAELPRPTPENRPAPESMTP